MCKGQPRVSCSKHLTRWLCIVPWFNFRLVGATPCAISVAYAMAKTPQSVAVGLQIYEHQGKLEVRNCEMFVSLKFDNIDDCKTCEYKSTLYG